MSTFGQLQATSDRKRIVDAEGQTIAISVKGEWVDPAGFHTFDAEDIARFDLLVDEVTDMMIARAARR